MWEFGYAHALPTSKRPFYTCRHLSLRCGATHPMCFAIFLFFGKHIESSNILRNVENWPRDVAADFAVVGMRCRVALASTWPKTSVARQIRQTAQSRIHSPFQPAPSAVEGPTKKIFIVSQISVFPKTPCCIAQVVWLCSLNHHLEKQMLCEFRVFRKLWSP